MNTLNHALWGATIGRSVGLPIEGAIAGALPDLSNLPNIFYMFRHHLPVKKLPKWSLKTYSFFHNWWFAVSIIGILYFVNPRLSILGLCYFWHVAEDAVFHKKVATRFLWPIWKGKIQKYSAAEHKWVQVVDFLLIVVVNLWLNKKL